MPASTITPPEIQIAIDSNIFQNSTEFITGSRLHSVLTVINAGLATIYDSGALSIAIGAAPVTGGANTQILYDNAGTLGGYTISGAGTVVAMAASPVFTSPTLGIAIGTSLALGGAVVGSNALAATGTITASGDIATGDNLIQAADTGGVYLGAANDTLLSRAAAGVFAMPKLAINGATIGTDTLAIIGTMACSSDIVTDGNFSLGLDSGKLYFGHLNDNVMVRLTSASLGLSGLLVSNYNTALPAAGNTGVGMTFTTTANFGVFVGSGAPTLHGAKGSLYLRSDGSTTNDRAYIATDSTGTWTALTTAA